MERMILETIVASEEVQKAENLIREHNELLHMLRKNITAISELALKPTVKITKADDTGMPTAERIFKSGI